MKTKIFIMVILEGGILNDVSAFRFYFSKISTINMCTWKGRHLKISVFGLFSFSLLYKCYTVPIAT